MIDLFTKQEKIFISFLLFAIIVGAGAKIYKSYSRAAPQLTQPGDIQETEKQIQQKAALIDSLLEVRTLTFTEANLVEHEVSFVTVDSSKESNNKRLLIEINSATATELVQLPQIGPVLADRIVEYRNTYGAFKDIEELIKVKGIGKKKLKTIRSYLYIK
jgi:comEA protein